MQGKVIPGTGAQGQVIRPATASPASVTTPILPSYSQAISQTTGGGTIVRAIRPSIGTAAAGTVVGTIRRPSDGLASSNGPTVGQRFSLTTLLAGKRSDFAVSNLIRQENVFDLMKFLVYFNVKERHRPIVRIATAAIPSLPEAITAAAPCHCRRCWNDCNSSSRPANFNRPPLPLRSTTMHRPPN